MGVLSASEHRFLTAVSKLAYCNPFLPERIELERAALGKEFTPGAPVWSASVHDPEALAVNVLRLHERLEAVLPGMRSRLSAGSPADGEWELYEDAAHYFLYQGFYPKFVAANGRFGFYREFASQWAELCPEQRSDVTCPHAFAVFWQLRRAFHHIFDNIIGNSLPAAELRASVWQSVFTHDMRRYVRALYRKMGEFPTLVTGPSGTGKELIARAIAGSRFIPFDEHKLDFVGNPPGSGDAFLPINIAALSPTLIESELFGHRRGSFTGAIGDRKGWLESCPPYGSVFLDELGEMDLSLQVKLLRAIETRRFSAVGDTAPREFKGKLIAATNRELPAEIRAGRFREDLYYRLCADLIRTPSLADQLRDSPAALSELILYMTQRTVGMEEAARCVDRVESWIASHLPRDYDWPGNYRELEQCVRNVIIRESYRPMERSSSAEHDEFLSRFKAGSYTADELLGRYAAQVYRVTGSYEEAARRMGLDRRTVKAKVAQYLESTSDATAQ